MPETEEKPTRYRNEPGQRRQENLKLAVFE